MPGLQSALTCRYNYTMTTKQPAVQVSELFGPTLAGEGMDIGRACLFVRLHNCPVKCPGCDTSFTWSGVETGIRTPIEDIRQWVFSQLEKYPGVGVVLSGGEPLIHWRNNDFIQLVKDIASRTWIAMETSGFIGSVPLKNFNDENQFYKFVQAFTRVHLSPKITPCLHGDGWTDQELLCNVSHILTAYSFRIKDLALKFVVRDAEDVTVVKKFARDFEYYIRRGHPIYLMPYGQQPAEIMEVCNRLIPDLAQTGYILSPRLHSLLWGSKRGV